MPWLSVAAEPEASEQEARLSALCDACPAATRATARRFLVARQWRLDGATLMLRRHIEWSASDEAAVVGRLGLVDQTAPSRAGISPAVAALLASRRFRVLRAGAEPVVAVDFLWGRFMEGASADELLRAYLAFLSEVLAAADAARPPDSPAKVASVLVGGPPPMAYARLAHRICEANFPERLGTSAIYPVPWVVKAVVDASARRAPPSSARRARSLTRGARRAGAVLVFLPRETRKKLRLASTPAQLCDIVGLTEEALPDDLRRGVEAVKEDAARHFG
jgi:hypothetical protein